MIKLCDFGWAVYAPNDQRRETLCGTPDYVSPEMLINKIYNKTVDIWSIGILMYEFLTGKPPFETWSCD
jgi:serine/threonine protein kinase